MSITFFFLTTTLLYWLDCKTVVVVVSFSLACSQRREAPKASEAWILFIVSIPVPLYIFTLAPDLSLKNRAHSYNQRKKYDCFAVYVPVCYEVIGNSHVVLLSNPSYGGSKHSCHKIPRFLQKFRGFIEDEFEPGVPSIPWKIVLKVPRLAGLYPASTGRVISEFYPALKD